MLLAVQEVIEKFVDLSFDDDERPEENDKACAYACDTLSLGLRYCEFCDAIKGDGSRILRCWKFLLIFKSSNRANYAIYRSLHSSFPRAFHF